ncbi:MAG: hypothetical protein COB04_02200 [Gammaproteobacteria bacterium]|nr:MAG: hypothetical protein COB04_02200 [Gammaproteobacteria bacterium]
MPDHNNDWQEKSLRFKITVVFTLAIILSISGTSLYSYTQYKSHLIETKTEQLKSIRSAKSRQIEAYFKQIRNQIETLSESIMVIDAVNEFKQAYNSVPTSTLTDTSKTTPNSSTKAPTNNKYEQALYSYYKNEYSPRVQYKTTDNKTLSAYTEISPTAKYLQYHYIYDNPYPTKKKDQLSLAQDQSQYSQVHHQYHNIFKKYLNKFGYYDIFIVDAITGNILYSVYKEVDYATSLLTGPYKDSNLGRLFREVRSSNDKDFVKLIDFEAYLPSYNQPASFIGSPIYDGDTKVGILIFQMPIDEINSIMTSDENWYLEGLGYSGETILVGNDHKMRSQSRFLIEDPAKYYLDIESSGENKSTINHIEKFSSAILLQHVKSTATENALKGEMGVDIIQDYRNQEVLAAYLPLNIRDVEWIFIAKYDMGELLDELATLTLNTLMGILVFLLVFFSFVLYFSRNISLPFETLKRYTATLLSNAHFHPLRLSTHALANQLGSSINSIGKSIDHHLQTIEQILKGQDSPVHAPSNKLEAATQAISNHISAISHRYSTLLTELIKQHRSQILSTDNNMQRARLDLERFQKMNLEIGSVARENKLISTINGRISEQVSLFIEQQRELHKELACVNTNVDELVNEHMHRDLMKRYIKDFGTLITTTMRNLRREERDVKINDKVKNKLTELDAIFKRMDTLYNEHFDLQYTKILLINREIRKITVYFEVQSNREKLVLDIANDLESRTQLQYGHLQSLNQTIADILAEIQTQEISEQQMSNLLTQISCACINLQDRFGDATESQQQENPLPQRKAS